jgi:hypothetical protein
MSEYLTSAQAGFGGKARKILSKFSNPSLTCTGISSEDAIPNWRNA